MKNTNKSETSVRTLFQRFKTYSIAEIVAIAHSDVRNAKTLMHKPKNFKNATMQAYINNANSLIDLLVQPTQSDKDIVLKLYKIVLTDESVKNFEEFEKLNSLTPIDHIRFDIDASDIDELEDYANILLSLNKATTYTFARIIIGYTYYESNELTGKMEISESAISTKRVLASELDYYVSLLIRDACQDLIDSFGNYSAETFTNFTWIEIYWS